MKKYLKIILPFLAILLVLNGLQAKGDFNLTIGATFDYDVIESYWDITQETYSGSGNGFVFRDTSYPISTPISIEVITPSNTSVYYTITVSDKTDEAYDYSSDIIAWVFVMMFPNLRAQLTPLPWNQTEIEMGPNLFELFFVDPVSFGDVFVQFTNVTYISSIFDDPRITVSQVEAHFDNSSTIAIFDWVNNIRYYNETLGTNFQGEFYLKLAYNQNQGNLMGFKVDMNYSGNILGLSYSINWRQHIEAAGYNLPTLYFKSEPPGFISIGWAYIFPPLIVISMVYKFYKKKIKLRS
ncbi:MAG: hypothetical protein FK731_07925 [Asgard group archaeon]|nr:hypothetical protein [Asgard group archaeon]